MEVYKSADVDTCRQIAELVQVQMFIHPGYPELYVDTMNMISTAGDAILTESELQSIVSKFTTSKLRGEGVCLCVSWVLTLY